ncbi:MAG: hypothetical protein JNL70_07005, partial [Saprospiraceae bacterium]|nr:hypothetical protein [Saprospiraceae bacterium]
MQKFDKKTIGLVKVAKSKNRTWTEIDNDTLRDANLSNEALGLLCRSLANAENWQTNIEGAARMSRDGKKPITRQLHELQQNGYAYLIVEKDATTKAVKRKYYRLFEAQQSPDLNPIVEFVTADNERFTANKKPSKVEKLINEVGAADENELLELLRQAKNLKNGTPTLTPVQTETPTRTATTTITDLAKLAPPSVFQHFSDVLRRDSDFLGRMKSKYNVTDDDLTGLIDCFKDNEKAKQHTEFEKFRKHFENWIPIGLKILAVKNRPQKQHNNTSGTKKTKETKKEVIQEIKTYKAMMDAATTYTEYKDYRETVKNLIFWTEKAHTAKWLNDEQIRRLEELKQDFNTAGAL